LKGKGVKRGPKGAKKLRKKDPEKGEKENLKKFIEGKNRLMLV
jgi:hypothetical protein